MAKRAMRASRARAPHRSQARASGGQYAEPSRGRRDHPRRRLHGNPASLASGATQGRCLLGHSRSLGMSQAHPCPRWGHPYPTCSEPYRPPNPAPQACPLCAVPDGEGSECPGHSSKGQKMQLCAKIPKSGRARSPPAHTKPQEPARGNNQRAPGWAALGLALARPPDQGLV